MLDQTKFDALKAKVLFLSSATEYLNTNGLIKSSIFNLDFLNRDKNSIMDIDRSPPEIAMYSLFDNANNFYILIPGTGLNKSGIVLNVLSLFQSSVFDVIECALGPAKAVNQHLNELHPKLMKNITKYNLKSINFAGHSFGGMECSLFGLIYALLIDFYKNHYNCTKDACCCSNEPVHPKITCKLLRGFVYKFYLYHYETGYLEMWNHGEAISSYKKDLYLDCHCKDIEKIKFNDLLNKSIDEVIHQMMECDKKLLENLVIENIYTFGSPAILSKEWANIYNAYFYNPSDIENSKHLSFQNEDDLFAGFGEEGGPYYLTSQFYNFFTTLRIVSRSAIGVIVKICNKAKLVKIQSHQSYSTNITLANKFEFYSNNMPSTNRMNVFISAYETFIYADIVSGIASLIVGIALEIPYIIFTPILLISKLFGANIFLHTHQIVVSIATWLGIGLYMAKYVMHLI